MASPNVASGWRLLAPQEKFEAAYYPLNRERAYSVSVQVLVPGHGSFLGTGCHCTRCHLPELQQWVLLHSDLLHGPYPIHYRDENQYLAQLLRNIPGRVVSYGRLSFGAIGEKQPTDGTSENMLALLDSVSIGSPLPAEFFRRPLSGPMNAHTGSESSGL